MATEDGDNEEHEGEYAEEDAEVYEEHSAWDATAILVIHGGAI